MGVLAVSMFVALFAFGDQLVGWVDPDGHIKLALITAFILGIIGGFKVRG